MIRNLFSTVLSHMKRNDFEPKQHWVWSDGCTSQFKSKKPFYFISCYPNMTNGCSMLWSFFESGHGKGPHDGASVVVKCFIRREQLKPYGVKLQSAGDYRAPPLEECPQHHGHKRNPGVTPGTCGAIGERAQVILVWVRAPGRWERLPPTEIRSHEG